MGQGQNKRWMTYDDRKLIEMLWNEFHCSVTDIAKELNSDRGTIMREIRRGALYDADRGQRNLGQGMHFSPGEKRERTERKQAREAGEEYFLMRGGDE